MIREYKSLSKSKPINLPAFFIDIQSNDDLLDYQTDVISAINSDEELVKQIKGTFDTSPTKAKNLFIKSLKEYGANFPLINEVPIKQWFWKEFAQQNEIDLSKEKEKKTLSQAEQDRLDSLAEKSAGKSVGSKLNIEANRLKDIKTNLPKLFAE